MKLDQRPTSPETSTQMAGLTVTLRSLNTQVLKVQDVSRQEPAGLGALLMDKLPPYVVGPQDILLVTVWDHPELTLPLGQYRTDNASGMVVDEEGFLFFPFVGKVLVKGQTPSQVRDTLTMQLGKSLRNPQVDVKVIAYRSQKVFVGGDVRTPALYNITDVPFTLAEAVNRAGGFLPTADDSRILLTRGDRSWKLNFQELMGAGNRIGQILLKDGDSLHVPNAQESTVYVMGELVKPGSLPLMHGNLSLAQAISDAGGILTTSAKASSIYVIRKGATAQSVDVFHLDGRNPTTMVLADQFALRPRDIVYVDAGSLVRWNRVWNMLLPTVTAVTGAAGTVADIKFLRK